MQTGSSGTLIGWKSGQPTFVPLWYWMEGAWLRTQGVTKRCRLSWLTNSALVYEPKCGGRGGVAGSQPMSTDVHRSPNKRWRSNYIFFFLSVYIFSGLECAGRSLAYVAIFVFFERCLDSNPESCRCKQARYQLSHPISLTPYLTLAC